MTCSAYLVMGTSGPAATMRTPGLARSAGEAMPAGLAVGTTMTRWFVAKSVMGAGARHSSMSAWGFLVSADANTSDGAPCSIWALSALEASKLKVSVEPACWAAQAWPITLNGLVRDAAAKIVRLGMVATGEPNGASVGRGDWARAAVPPRSNEAATTSVVGIVHMPWDQRFTRGPPR